MRRKSLWVLVISVLIIAMLLTACKTTPTTTTTTNAATTTTTAATTTKTTTVTTTTTTTTIAEGPKYGGPLNVALSAELTSYDQISLNPHAFSRMIYESLLIGDIQTTEDQWAFYGLLIPKQYLAGCLLESWEEIGTDTVIFHLRQGIHFQNIAPVNGRELTADDVVYSTNRAWLDPKSLVATAHNLKSIIKSITALDTYTVEYKFNPAFAPEGWVSTWYKSIFIVAKEVVDKYGSLANPIGQVGTGPYIITDYVPGSAFTCVRNPDYWGTDPRYPGNKLPYIDKTVTTIIPDLSTRLAALRTGKVARLTTIPWSQAESLVKTNPEILTRKILAESNTHISTRDDLKPFSDVRVRRALSMAIERQALVDQYYNGNASYSNYLVPSQWLQYIPLDQFSEEIREIYEFHPDKSRQLLIDAGYPTGFNTEIQISSANTSAIEVMQLVKAWWADIGVNVDLKVTDNVSWQSLQQKHTYPQMSFAGGAISNLTFGFSWIYQPVKGSFVSYNSEEFYDPEYNTKYKAYMDSWDQPQATRDALFKDLVTYTRWMTPMIDMPTESTYICWQPWLKGYWGQSGISFGSSGDIYKYMWIDKD